MRTINTKPVTVISKNTVIVGTGAAGFNAADRLYGYGQTDIALVTDHINAGTSRNTGSDKQTYYKLTLSGGEGDSVLSMAQTLFDGGCVDGEHALCEAALSANCFLKLCDLGVPFPVNRYGEYVGYKTDHDPRRRATSVGPYTSKRMTQGLEQAVKAKNIPIYDHCQVVSLLVEAGEIQGLVCLNLDDGSYTVFNTTNVIFATGGPAGLYADSVFPLGHYGASGLALEQGVMGKNLTEWQFGLASVCPRWNVSGTYMQVLPRFFSTDAQGHDPQEFLPAFFSDTGEMLSKVFLKGYQWPFDCRKVDGGSSIIDGLVYIETYLKGRRIFLDFRTNPLDQPVDFTALSQEAFTYLDKAGATFGTPIERLLHMNKPAVDFYLDKGVDLTQEPLEIALCAQHNNGGLGIDRWWQSNITGFFVAGEAAASHGVYRPGGSALNAGQVGAMRAAQYIARNRTQAPMAEGRFLTKTQDKIAKTIQWGLDIQSQNTNVDVLWAQASKAMSAIGGPLRNRETILALAQEMEERLQAFSATVEVHSLTGLSRAHRYRDMLVCANVYLQAMADYVTHGGKSRGSALYYDANGTKPYQTLPDMFTFSLEDGALMDKVQEVRYEDGVCHCTWRNVHPIPQEDDFFENVWRTYRENGNVY